MVQEVVVAKAQTSKEILVDIIEDVLQRKQDKEVDTFRFTSDKPLITAGGNEVVVLTQKDQFKVRIEIENPDISKAVEEAVKGATDTEVPLNPRGTVTVEDADIEVERKEETVDEVVRPQGERREPETIVGPVRKPFSKEDAKYRERGDELFDPAHPRCESCAHYDGEGNCHIVPDIEADEYCEEFYADLGMFADKSDIAPGNIFVNLTLLGENFDWDTVDAEKFLDEAADELDGAING